MLIGKKLQGGFTLIELIASMVLMGIMLPSVGLLVVNSMRAIATHNVSLQASVDAGYVQNNFAKHIDGLSALSASGADLTDRTLKFTSYHKVDNKNTTYEYTLRVAEKDIRYSRKIGAGTPVSGTLMKEVLVNHENDAFDSKFIYRDFNNTVLSIPISDEDVDDIKSVELQLRLLRGDEIYKHSIYVMPDHIAHLNVTAIKL
jgi:prepilin-type N-terminal cleavage/methylation domain-containing protein